MLKSLLDQNVFCRYFSTRNLASSGSFLREEKARLGLVKGSTVLEALQTKYENKQDDTAGDMRFDSRVRVELVGMAKLRQQRGGIDRLQEVVLHDSAISTTVRDPMQPMRRILPYECIPGMAS